MTLKQWLAVDAPADWTAVALRTVMMIVVGFVVFQVKEWSETGAFDTPDALLGAAWLAAAAFGANALHKLAR